MPRYFFDINEDGIEFSDHEGVELDDEAAARAEASRIASDVARDHLIDLSSSKIEVRVRDDGIRTICRETVELRDTRH
jgi:hypothetical protein